MVCVGGLALGAAWPQTQPRAAAAVTEIEAERLDVRADQGLVVLGRLPYTGVALRHDEMGRLVARNQYRFGKKHGRQEMWFADGTRSFFSDYVVGKRHGETRSWWRNGNPRTRSNFVEGRADGVQLQWYVSGAKFKEMRLRAGREVGMQRSWRENGKLYNNYEVHDGRIYGLKRSKLCFRIDDEEIQISK